MTIQLRRILASHVYYGWVIVFCCLLASIAAFGTSYTFAVFFDEFIQEFGVSRALLAAAFGIQTALLYVMGLVASRSVTLYGQRRVAALSGGLLTAGLVVTAFAQTYAGLLFGFGVVTALGMAGLYVVGYATVPVWFERRRGMAAGIASAGLGIGLIIIPPGADVLIAAEGWRTAMLAIAALVGGLSGLIALLFANQPADVGANRSIEFPDGCGTNGTETERRVTRSLRTILSSTRFWLVFVGWMLVFVPLYVVMSHIVLYASDVGLGRSAGVLAITVIGVSTTAARLSIGSLSDIVGRTKTFIVCAVLMGLTIGSLVFVQSHAAFFIAMMIFGVGYGGCGGLIGPQVADLFGDAHVHTLFAALSVSFAISGLLAPPLAGYAFELLGGYEVVLMATAVSGIVGSVCVSLAERLGQ